MTSKTKRFEIFKRDGFKCQYCGATPSDTVVLELDHIVPVSKGGADDLDNLVTACFACNRGKAARALEVIPMSLQEKAELTAEREMQIRAYYEVLKQRKERIKEESWEIAGVFIREYSEEVVEFRDGQFWTNDLRSIKTFLARLDFFEVLEAAEIASERINNFHMAFKYFCGVCWSKIKQKQEASQQKNEIGNVTPLKREEG